MNNFKSYSSVGGITAPGKQIDGTTATLGGESGSFLGYASYPLMWRCVHCGEECEKEYQHEHDHCEEEEECDADGQ